MVVSKRFDGEYVIQRTISENNQISIGRQYMPNGESVVGVTVEIEGIPCTLSTYNSGAQVTVSQVVRNILDVESGDDVNVRLLGYHVEEDFNDGEKR